MKLIAVIQTVKGLGGEAESQIRTQESVTVANRPVLGLAQGGVIVVCGLLLLGSLLLFTSTVERLMGFGLHVEDYMLVWTLAALAVLGISFLVRRAMAAEAHMVRVFVSVLLLMLLVVAVTAAFLTAVERPTWEVAKLGISLVFAFAALVLGYNQMKDLAQPYWRRSPLEDAVIRDVFPMLQGLLGAESVTGRDVSVRVTDPRFPVAGTLNGAALAERFGHSIADHVTKMVEADDELEEVGIIDPAAGNLVWFVMHAVRCRNLKLESLALDPVPTLPFREDGKELRLRQTMIRRLLARGSTEVIKRVEGYEERGRASGGWWNLHGQGKTAKWIVPRERAIREVTEMWRLEMGDAPVPDYWRENLGKDSYRPIGEDIAA